MKLNRRQALLGAFATLLPIKSVAKSRTLKADWVFSPKLDVCYFNLNTEKFEKDAAAQIYKKEDVKALADIGAEYIRVRIREEGFARKVLQTNEL